MVLRSAWGEGLFLLLETALIAALVLRFRGQSGRAAAFTLSYAALLTLLLSKLVPVSVLWAAQLASVPVIISGKVSWSLAARCFGGALLWFPLVTSLPCKQQVRWCL
uniref:Uncharacterized protein n=1 Tax=Ixodes scapularis TaxID=6945 RepID=A0A4D5RDW9_IXOSC